jgi:sulfate adenylyltransferase
MRLADGTLWPIPVTLDVPERVAVDLGPGAILALRGPEGALLGVVHVEEVWEPDRLVEARVVYGTTDRQHPGVAHLLDGANRFYVGGRVEGVRPPVHYDFRSLRQAPAELRAEFARLGWHRVVAFQTRNPMHRAHVELTLRAAQKADARLLIHPVVGMTRPGDVDHYTRVRCYERILPRYPEGMARLALLPLAMRMAGPREAVWHAIIRRNYGCSHFIVGRDHAGPGNSVSGRPFYEPYAAQDLVGRHEEELGIQVVPFRTMAYVKHLDAHMPEDEVPPGTPALDISGTELRRRLAGGEEVPRWFTFPEVAAELRRRYPPRSLQGFAVFLTGLPAAGKSTIGNVLLARFSEMGGRSVTVLDGDIVRKHLSSELGFSKEDRDTNVRRVGFVASEIVKHGGIAICALIAPYDQTRKEVRRMVEANGSFALVHVATPLGVCEARDPRGLYRKARGGLLEGFTGISDPYEHPDDADVIVNAAGLTPEAAAEVIIAYLKRTGHLVEGERCGR